MPAEISPTTMTDEELDKALAENQGGSEVPETPDKPTTDPVPDAPAPEVPPVQPAKGTPELEAPKSESAPETELQVAIRELREARKFNGRLSNELGQLRSQVRQAPKPTIAEPTDEDFVTNPKAAHERLIAAKSEQQAIWQQETQARQAAELESVRNTVSAAIPTFEQSLPQMAELLAKEDEVPPEWLNAFKQNPHALGVTGLYHLAKRAEAVQQTRVLQARVAELERQLGEAKKTPGKMVDAINRGQRAFSSPTANPNATAPVALAGLTNMDLAKATDEELDNYLALAAKEK